MTVAVIWTETDRLGARYFLAGEELALMNGVFINAGQHPEQERALSDLLFDVVGRSTFTFVSQAEFEHAVRNGALVTNCGFVA